MEKKNVLGLLLMLGIVLSSCSRVTDFGNTETEGEQGLLSFTLTAETNFARTRAVMESSYENVGDYTVVVIDNYGVERMNCKASEVAPLILNVGDYTVKAFYGVEEAVSRDTFYVYGETKGYILPDEEDTVEVECTPTCGRIRVEFDEKMDSFFCEYNVEFSGTKAMKAADTTAVWAKGDSIPWYVKLEEGGEELTYTITAKTKDEYVNKENQKAETTYSGKFSLERNKGYKLTLAPGYSATGKVGITITVDDTTNDKPVDIEVPIEWT